jgi:hypothetical protein
VIGALHDRYYVTVGVGTTAEHADAAGIPYVLTQGLDVVRYDAGVWTHLTRFWPQRATTHLKTLVIAPDSTLVIGTKGAGVLLWKPGEATLRQVRLN